jgi:hypothetical protein
MKLLSSVRMASISLVLGMTFSIAYNAAAVLLFRSTDPDGRGMLAHIVLAPGMLLAGQGFEERMAILPLNVISFAIIFAIVIRIVFSRRHSSVR